MTSAASIFDRARTDRRDLINMERLRESIAAHNLDAVIAVDKTNVLYSGGALVFWGFVVTTVDGSQGAVTNEADAYNMRQYSWIKNIKAARFTTEPFASSLAQFDLLVDLLEEMELSGTRLGIDTHVLSHVQFGYLLEKLHVENLSDGSRVFSRTRLVKTPAEIELFRRAAHYTDKAIHTAFALSKPGESEKDVAARMQSMVLQLGADELSHCHLHTGVHSTVAHAMPLEREKLEPGDVVHIDFGGVFGGYHTDLSRNAVVVQGNSKQLDIYRRLWDVEQIMIEKMRPGITAGELFDVGQHACELQELKHPWGTFGHSTGLSLHEGFEIASGSTVPLELGMLVNVEPSHIEPEDARYHIEDTLLIMETGAEIVSDYTRTDAMIVIK